MTVSAASLLGYRRRPENPWQGLGGFAPVIGAVGVIVLLKGRRKNVR